MSIAEIYVGVPFSHVLQFGMPKNIIKPIIDPATRDKMGSTNFTQRDWLICGRVIPVSHDCYIKAPLKEGVIGYDMRKALTKWLTIHGFVDRDNNTTLSDVSYPLLFGLMKQKIIEENPKGFNEIFAKEAYDIIKQAIFGVRLDAPIAKIGQNPVPLESGVLAHSISRVRDLFRHVGCKLEPQLFFGVRNQNKDSKTW